MEIEWVEELPAGKNLKGKYLPLLLALRERPEIWAQITTTPTEGTACAVASHFRKGRLIVPPGQYEYAARGTTVYARYIGEEEK